MLNFYIKSFNVCLTAAGNQAKKNLHHFAVLAVQHDKPRGQNMAVTLRARNSVNTLFYDQSNILDLVTSWKAIV